MLNEAVELLLAEELIFNSAAICQHIVAESIEREIIVTKEALIEESVKVVKRTDDWIVEDIKVVAVRVMSAAYLLTLLLSLLLHLLLTLLLILLSRLLLRLRALQEFIILTLVRLLFCHCPRALDRPQKCAGN